MWAPYRSSWEGTCDWSPVVDSSNCSDVSSDTSLLSGSCCSTSSFDQVHLVRSIVLVAY